MSCLLIFCHYLEDFGISDSSAVTELALPPPGCDCSGPGDDVASWTPAPCPILEAEMTSIRKEDSARGLMDNLKDLDPVCPGVSLYWKVPALILYILGGVAIIAAVILMICKR